MSDEDVTALAPDKATAATSASAGALLRQAREAAGLHIAALAVSLKVPVRKIEALEADRWDDLPGSAFVRALAASVCRSLRIDPSPVLALLPAATPTLLRDAGSLNRAEFSGGGRSSLANAYRLLARPAGLTVLLLLLAALLIYLWPAAEQAARRVDLAPASPGDGALPRPTGTGPADALPEPVSSPSEARPPVVQAAAAAPSAASGLPSIVIKAKGSSWIEVVDARQVVLLRRTLGAGESASAEGAPPLTVVVGRANVIEVLVRGQALDLSSLSKDNVARFEVK